MPPAGQANPFSGAGSTPKPAAPVDQSRYGASALQGAQWAQAAPEPGLASQFVKNWVFDKEQCEHDVDYDALDCSLQIAGITPGLGALGKTAGKLGNLKRAWRWLAGEKIAPDAARLAPKGRYLQRFTKRRAYVYEVNAIKKDVAVLTAMGVGRDEIAEFAYNRRIALKLKFRKATPQPLRWFFSRRNTRLYGDPIGLTYGERLDELLDSGMTREDAFEKLIRSAPTSGDTWYLK